MSKNKSTVNNSGIGMLGIMLILGYGPLDWNFPQWLWGLSLAGPILLLFVLIVGAFATVIK